MPTPQQKATPQAAPDFIPADPDFIPVDGGSAATSTPSMAAQPGNIFTSGHPIDTFRANVDEGMAPWSPEEKAKHGVFTNTLHSLGRGFTETLAQPLAHPVDAITGMAKTAKDALVHSSQFDPENPLNKMVGSTVQDFEDNGASDAIPHLLGQAGGTAIGGEIASPFVKMGLSGAGMAARGVGRGMEVASATPESLKVFGTRALTPGQSAADLFTRAAKPTSAYGDFADDIGTIAPKLAEQAPRYGGLKGMGDTLKNIKTQANDWYQNTIDPFRKFSVDASPIADAQMSSIPITDRIEQPPTYKGGPPPVSFPKPTGQFGKTLVHDGSAPGSAGGGIVARTAAKADNFRQPMSLGTLDDVRVDTNAKLQNIWNKSGGDRNAALSEPENAREFATNNASRDLVYKGINRMSAAGRADVSNVDGLVGQDGGVPISEIQGNQSTYGAANKLDDVFNRRGIVYARQNPMSLQETLAAGKMSSPLHAAVNWAGTHLLKSLTDSDPLANAGLDKLINPDRAGLVSRSGVFPRMTAAVGRGMQAAGKEVPNLARQPLNSLFFAPTQKR